MSFCCIQAFGIDILRFFYCNCNCDNVKCIAIGTHMQCTYEHAMNLGNYEQRQNFTWFWRPIYYTRYKFNVFYVSNKWKKSLVINIGSMSIIILAVYKKNYYYCTNIFLSKCIIILHFKQKYCEFISFPSIFLFFAPVHWTLKFTREPRSFFFISIENKIINTINTNFSVVFCHYCIVLLLLLLLLWMF